ncbi:hypothetical protein ASL14_21445 [Paenibacillus sp. IHB B 3084]|uniref:hypothetical protein n=1 Tax=Paenibacillus sp. IHB B 3084 TaxID=867076 RepID=UPI000722ABBF|nr:hypothetical protein [Paenibacillus sp. IHB B 3084]ALP39131.1 hypothetical protein ASL14_21445 [Paenibacillus sp. IHB B 3084]
MDQEKKRAILLHEIEHWRRSRLLPEQYCDFLSNLYREDENPSQSQSHSSTGLLTYLRNGHGIAWLLGFVIISCICLIGFYFTAFPLAMQIFSACAVTGICYGVAAVWRSSEKSMSAMLSILGSVIMLGSGVWIIQLHQGEPKFWFLVLVGLCGLVWCLVGLTLRIILLRYCGFIALLLVYAVLIGRYWPTASHVMLEGFWVLHAALLVWLCWWVHRRFSRLASVYFAIGMTLVFMPEADMIVLRHQASGDVVLYGLLKLAIVVGILFWTRKKWITWVTS